MAKEDKQDTPIEPLSTLTRAKLEDMTSHRQRGGVSTDYVHVTHRARSSQWNNNWQYFDGDTTCECGLPTENTVHML